MKNIIQIFSILFIIITLPLNNQAQTPNLRSLSSFIIFTTDGAVSNTGISQITGNVGTGVGAVSPLSAPTFNGSIFINNTTTTQASNDLTLLCNDLAAANPTNTTHTPAFGSGETILPGVYTIGGAGSIAGILNLNAAGNADAIFIFRFGGAFTTGAVSTVNLLNGAKACNVFWVANGAISMAASTDIIGTLIANSGAVSMGAGGKLNGRMLSTVGAISVNTVNITVSTGCQSCIPQPGTSTWLGADNNWQNINNWCGGMPLLTTNILIPS